MSGVGVAVVGASGAIFGLFGALYVLQRRVGQSSTAILSTIALNLIITFTIPNISWEGHVGGLITGTALTAALAATVGPWAALAGTALAHRVNGSRGGGAVTTDGSPS